MFNYSFTFHDEALTTSPTSAYLCCYLTVKVWSFNSVMVLHTANVGRNLRHLLSYLHIFAHLQSHKEHSFLVLRPKPQPQCWHSPNLLDEQAKSQPSWYRLQHFQLGSYTVIHQIITVVDSMSMQPSSQVFKCVTNSSAPTKNESPNINYHIKSEAHHDWWPTHPNQKQNI